MSRSGPLLRASRYATARTRAARYWRSGRHVDRVYRAAQGQPLGLLLDAIVAARVPVPDEGKLRLGTVRLPAGRLLRSQGGTGEPVAWITEAPVPEPGLVWSALSAPHGQTGLVPILAPTGRGDDLEAACRDTAAVADVDRVDAAALLEQLWADCLPELWQAGPERAEDWQWADDMAAPFTSRFPGLAPAVDSALAADVLAAAVGSFPASASRWSRRVAPPMSCRCSAGARATGTASCRCPSRWDSRPCCAPGRSGSAPGCSP